MFSPILAAIFPLLMAWAASSDLFTMRISNVLVGVVALVFFMAAIFAGMPLPAIGMHVLAGLCVLAITFTLFALGWIGGGDAKLAAAIGMWMGFGFLLPFLLYASALGGALTLLLLVGRRYALPGPLLKAGWLVRLHHPKTGVPYGIALALAAMIVYPQTFIYDTLIVSDVRQQALLEQLSSF